METRLLGELDAREPGCTEAVLEELQTAVGRTLPGDYLDFLRWSNGYNGHMSHTDGEERYIRLHDAESVRLATLDGDHYQEEDRVLLGAVEIGDVGAGAWKFVLMPDDTYALAWIATDDEPERLAGSFAGLLEALADEPR